MFDSNALQRWMRDSDVTDAPVEDVSLLRGGSQNMLARIRCGSDCYVLRRGPMHLRDTSNNAIRREIRVLAALATTDVPHPRLIAACTDPDVLDGAVFYLMQDVVGVNPIESLSAYQRESAAVRHAMGLAAVDAAAAIAAVDYLAVGLDGLGRPGGFLERQTSRWLAHLDSYHTYNGYIDEIRPMVDIIASWLAANVPLATDPGLIHGDYHLGNLLYQPDTSRVAAVVDWEMTTIGDPRLDLGWLLATWPGQAGGLEGAIARAGGLPSKAAIIARYAERTGRDVSAAEWFEVLACFKLGIVSEGTYARACAGLASPRTGDALHRLAIALLTRAGTSVSRSS